MFGFFKKKNAPKPWGELSEIEKKDLRDKVTHLYVSGMGVEEIANSVDRNLRFIIMMLTQQNAYKKIDKWWQEYHLKKLQKEEGFLMKNFLFGVNGHSVALSTKNTIAHVKNDTTDIEAKIFPLSSVLSFDLTANGTRIQTFEPGTKIGSAAIGGLLFGGAGAVVGAIVGNRGGTKSSNITTVGVKDGLKN
jgi:hypothetical protein